MAESRIDRNEGAAGAPPAENGAGMSDKGTMTTGRPTKLDKRLQNRIVSALKTGASIEDVCQHVGIARSTFHDWVQRGQQGEDGYSDFSDAITRARIAAKITAVGTLRSAMSPTKSVKRVKETFTETRFNPWGKEFTYTRTDEREIETDVPGDWRAAVEYLKRRHAEWGDKQTTFNFDVPPDKIERLMKALERAGMSASDLFDDLIREIDAQHEDVSAAGGGAAADRPT